MSGENGQRQNRTARKGRKADAAELAARLRANLQRRKRQQRARQQPPCPEDGDAGHDSGGA